MLTLSSPAFSAGGTIPSRYTCSGDDLSPPLTWTGSPTGTLAFALIVDDPDANGWIHWIFTDLPGATTSLREGATTSLPAVQGLNSWGSPGWRGPCPPSGTHRYVFTLYALDAALGLSGTPSAGAVRSAMAGHVLAQATLLGRFAR